VVALTHDPKLDDLALMEALKSPAFYVGALGSRANNAKRRERLQEVDVTEAEIARLHGPIGLYIGSRTPPEIAISILAEITAVKNGVPEDARINVAIAKGTRRRPRRARWRRTRERRHAVSARFARRRRCRGVLRLCGGPAQPARPARRPQHRRSPHGPRPWRRDPSDARVTVQRGSTRLRGPRHRRAAPYLEITRGIYHWRLKDVLGPS
jgi:hypothetical protein